MRRRHEPPPQILRLAGSDITTQQVKIQQRMSDRGFVVNRGWVPGWYYDRSDCEVRVV